MTEANDSILADLNRRVGGDILVLNYAHVIAQIARLNPEEKTHLLAYCVAALRDERARKDERLRITTVRAVVALLPLSLEMVADLLVNFSSKHDYEIHFTLFCYLDWTQEMPDALPLTKSVLPLVENYLLQVPRETARAAWMAVDMLGDHWDTTEALPVLINVARNARHSVGREGGILGLEKALERLTVENSASHDVLEVLQGVSFTDRSRRVREEAQSVILGRQTRREGINPTR